MPNYVFRIRSDDDDAQPVSVELQSDEQVRQEAVKTAAGFMHEHGPVPVDWAIEAKDKDGRNVARVQFSVE